MALTTNDTYKQIVDETAAIVRPSDANNFFPLFTFPLEQHVGVSITGTFETNDASETGVMSYVTVLRDAASLNPSHGLGFAWRKGDGSEFNVYLVDNNALTDELYVTPTFIVQDSGDNAFLAAGKKPIVAGTKYYFQLDIATNYAMSLAILAGSAPDPVTNQVVSTGARTTAPRADGSHFGFGVLGTQGRQWWYDDIVVKTNVGIHMSCLLKLHADTTSFPDGTNATINIYAYGKDGSTYGLYAYVREYVSGEWVWVLRGSNTSAENPSSRANTLLSIPITVTDNITRSSEFVNVLLTTPTATNGVSEVGLYYACLQNALPSGIHVGGMADIYINDPSHINTVSQTATPSANKVALTTGNGFYLPLHSIISVTLASNNVTVPWVLVTADPSTTFSTRESMYLALTDNSPVKITYRYYSDGAAIQTQLESDNMRYSGADNLGKIMPPVLISIDNLEYKGGISIGALRVVIQDFINNKTDTLSISDILNLLYEQDIDYINTATMIVTYQISDTLRVFGDVNTLTDTLVLEPLQAFFIDNDLMMGIIKL